MPSTSVTKALGLNRSTNALEVPNGSMVEASNIIIRRDDVIESRRGYDLFGTAFGTSTDRCKQMAEYKNKIIRHYLDKLQFEYELNNAGEMQFKTFSGSYLEAIANYRFRSIESNGNLYFTSSDGIKKISAKTASDLSTANDYITQAGGIKALDIEARLNVVQGETGGFLPQDSVVGYRVVWGSKDANGNLILGTPSDYVTVYNFLSNLLILDFNKLLNSLDNIDQTGSIIDDGNYQESLDLSTTDTAITIRSNLIELAKKIDQDIIYAKSTLGAAPLQITSVTVASGVVTIQFAQDASNYFDVGTKINLDSFYSGTATDAPVEINKNQTVSLVNSPSVAPFQIRFTPAAYSTSTPVGISGSIDFPSTPGPGSITVTSVGHGLKTNQKIKISNSSDPGLTNTVYNVNSVLTADEFTITAPGAISSFGNANWSIELDGLTNAKIESYSFRDIEQPSEPTLPTTNAQLVSLQNYLQSIINELQSLKSSVVSSALKNEYLDNILLTNSANTTIDIVVPPGVLSGVHFYQLYRTDILSATGTDILSDFTPVQEYRLVDESFPPTTTGFFTIEDITPESVALVGSNLYTNERSGEGALQSNDVPPFATDINTFKNYIFYSNTRTRHRKTINLLGVQNMLDTFDISNPPKISISNDTTKTYTFVTGLKQETKVITTASSIALASKYFLINSAYDDKEYYVWYSVNQASGSIPTIGVAPAGVITITTASPHGLSNGTQVKITNSTTVPSIDGVYTISSAAGSTFQITILNPITVAGTAGYTANIDPAITNKIGINVVINSTDSSFTVAKKTLEAINSLSLDFTCPANSGTLTFPILAAPGLITITTGANHNLSNGDTVEITNSTPNINGTYVISSVSNNTFQITLAAPVAAGSGSYTANNFKVINNVYGLATSSNAGDSGFTVSTTITGRGENPLTNQILLSDGGGSPSLAIEETAKSIVNVINKDTTNDTINAFYLSTTTPGTILLEAQSLNVPKFYVLASNSITGESFNPDISPQYTISTVTAGVDTTITVTAPSVSLSPGQQIVVINTSTTPTGVLDGLQTVKTVTSPSFTVETATTAASNIGAFSTIEYAESSDNEQQKHRVYYSKYLQPEAVPILNYIDVGATDKEILRVFPLRDSLFVFKEDGLFRISGEVAPFTLSLFDSSCILLARDSLDVANNQLYGWTTQGISVVTESGVTVISRPIDVDVLKIATYPNFKHATWGVGYESDNSYTVYTTGDVGDTFATIGYRFSNLTNTWTTIDKSSLCGINKAADDRLYLSPGDTNYIEQERKTFTRYDYADRELFFNISLDSLSGNTIKFPSVDDFDIGDALVQTQGLSIYEFNSVLKKLDIDPGVPSTNYYSTLNAPLGSDLRAKIVALAQKLDADGLQYTNYASSIAAISGITIASVSASNPAIVTTTTNHGLLTGRYINISGVTGLDGANGNFTVIYLSPTTFSIPISTSSIGSGGSLLTNNNSFNDIKACYNIIIDKLNSDSVVAYNNYSQVDTETVQEAVIVAIDRIKKQVTLNLALDYIVGSVSLFKAIPCSLTYTPNLMGDPLSFKHIREATIMFINKAFTSASMTFSTDLLPEVISVNFNGDGKGIFGHSPFGSGFFGGASNSAPFRTYVPRQCQRCRFINIGFTHSIAREEFGIYGITLTGEVALSTRAYR